MRGYVRQRGKTWAYTVNLGVQRCQRCLDPEDGARFWIERHPLESCPKCGGELKERLERRQVEKSGYRTRTEAEDALNDSVRDIRHDQYTEPTKMTVAKYLTEWLQGVKTEVRPTTHLSYTGHVENHIIPSIGAVPLQKLTPVRVKCMYTTLQDNGRVPQRKKSDKDEESSLPPERTTLSATTVRKIHGTLRKALQDAADHGMVKRNVAAVVKPPSINADGGRHEMKTWTADQIRTFLEATRATRMYPLWVTLATTGMRRGEALGLRWEDVDVENARLSVRQNMTSSGYKVQIGEPKTRRGRRNIALDPATVPVLKAFRQQQLEEKMLWRQAGYTDTGLVFVQENGSPYHPDRVSKMFEAAVVKAKSPRIRLHDLRHTYATLALSVGVHPKTVSERLGHANISITLDTYSHAIPALEEQAAAKVASLFMPV